ncbi:hypothetical protein A2837_02260 [Candidatus Kaiserbacteria bacterium RIFCSPHIGHO2_01_FULL_46_22]|uniref:Peptidase S11 D-alanyl-D-alanine carboxypeptidase A N-terminal domain-containing protein n=1 Tax=Candidatus Kaiserbacteria bacterium RIFCSPHIGHO2_01_FULL_46_22 TaxID=1798475 RepID=A0A1F6BZR7_9BACT|nr:MAG: hypothetical protein A2837_02260 [Candidatus Kaiserbacteria bacterium RIFCSPHIGHO2_01_FULL_46_22]
MSEKEEKMESDELAAETPETEPSQKGDESASPIAEAFDDVSVNAAGKMPVVRQLALLSALLIGIFSLGALPFFASQINSWKGSQPASPIVSSEEVATVDQTAAEAFSDLYISAKSAIVIDLKTGEVLYEKSADQKLPLASITKLMTALVANEIVEEGMIVPITEEALAQSGDGGLKEGERFTLSRLTDLLLLTSSNDGAFALAFAAGRTLDTDAPAEAFVQAMNIRADELGLSSMSFRNPTGLDLTEDEAGAYGSARDVAKLLEYIVQNESAILEETTKAEAVYGDINGGTHSANNTNPVVDAIPGLIGSKTGYTTLAGGNLAIAWNAGVDRPVVAVVLASSHSGRFTDILRLVDATKQKLAGEE